MLDSDNKSSRPSLIPSPLRVEDPQEITLPRAESGINPCNDKPFCPFQEPELTAASNDDLPPLPTPTTNILPVLPPLDGAPQPQEWPSYLQDNVKRNRTQLSYVNKGILASKILFLDSDNKIDCEEEEVYLIGKKLFAPRTGISEEYNIVWGRSSIPSSMSKCKLRSYVDKSDHDKVSLIRTACFYFDDKYHDGNIPALLHSLTNKNISKNK